ncbi:hypothetical protein L873DRAFT_1792437 [Choiromyces venosus 120613-1]|uniref:C2H2-type domain-containing protein n=1 Tax=Choiromyces venosus 120613-1 TaxID=1336337 RepID=A0A3N4JEY8_9PEZI|nr:hypothetical protein L873DRAFT_1792437 [Choiromyces venosus 120613-1]
MMKESRHHDGTFVTVVIRQEKNGICPIALFIALAFADDAFESRINSPEVLMKLKVPEGKESLQILFKLSVLHRYLFRQCNRDSVSEEPSTVLQMGDLLKKLGLRMGYLEKLLSYSFRRGAGRIADDIGTDAKRNHLLGHGDSSVFKAYIPKTTSLDIQSAYRERPAQTKQINKALVIARLYSENPKSQEDVIRALTEICEHGHGGCSVESLPPGSHLSQDGFYHILSFPNTLRVPTKVENLWEGFSLESCQWVGCTVALGSSATEPINGEYTLTTHLLQEHLLNHQRCSWGTCNKRFSSLEDREQHAPSHTERGQRARVSGDDGVDDRQLSTSRGNS